MDLNDLLGEGGHKKRPDHPDFYRLSSIILALKADMTESQSLNSGDEDAIYARWRAHFEEIGDFESIEYHAIQAAIQIHGIQTAYDYARMVIDPVKGRVFKATLQAYFDGFIMGAQFERLGGHQEAPQ